jgi:arsenite methyltransferase
VPDALPNADELKTCCVTAYSSDLVSLLLGDSYHPGGLALTRRVAAAVDLRPGQRVLDVASGRGTSALLFAREYDVDVIGVDLAAANVALAAGAAQAAGLATRAPTTASTRSYANARCASSPARLPRPVSSPGYCDRAAESA